MKHFIVNIAASFLGLIGFSASLMLGSCEASDFYFEDGWDGNSADSSAVTVDTLQGIDVSMYEKARMFPGLVDTLVEHRIADTLVSFDLSRVYAGMKNLCLSTLSSSDTKEAPQPIYSTGLYAGAGELVTIYVPEGVWGLTVQIGMQSEDLTSNNAGLREPIVYIQKALYPGKNTVRSSLGGYIWLIRDRNTPGQDGTEIKFCGVYAAPDFIVGKTDKAEWVKKIRSTTVPWLDIQSTYMIISVERSRMEMYLSSDPDFAAKMEQAVKLWDNLIFYYYHSLGMNEGDTNIPEMIPQFADRFIFDVQLSANDTRSINNPQGLMFVKTSSFYDAMIGLDSVSNQHLFNVYNLFLSKYHPQSTPFSETYKETRFVPVYRWAEQNWNDGNSDRLGDVGISLTQTLPWALKFAAADTVKYKSTDLDSWWKENGDYDKKVFGLLPLVQIAKYESHYRQEEEWNAYRTLWTRVREGKWSGGSDMTYITTLCDLLGVDLTSFFEHWGYTLPDEIRARVAQYPLLDKEIWKIDPAAADPFQKVGDYDVAHHPTRMDRTGWNIIALDSAGNTNEDIEYTNESSKLYVSNLIDGNPYSYWSSYLSPKKDNYQDSPYSLPYYVVIDMGKTQSIDGFYYANGSTRCVSSFRVQTTDASDFSLQDQASQTWRDIGKASQTTETARKNERYVDFDAGKVSARYLRLVFDNNNLYTPSKKDTLGLFEQYHQYRQQKMSEFGTYYYKGK
ncbi:MAG: discoidin domain-containing protein [Paraprevotella sp.]|nr:discoidin domain-containing protein [Paraprevotella sp.]